MVSRSWVSRSCLGLAVICYTLPAIAAEPPQPAVPASTIRAADRGGPYLFLRDGQRVPTNYGSTLPISQMTPTALASADFDEDGTPDLASGYAASDGTGVITVHRGNVHALWPYGEAVRHGEPPAFLPDARVFTVPVAPDFLAAGDFDADGHWDLVAAHTGGKSVYLLRGDGHGGFAAAERIDLPGTVTAFTVGEINRRDGLTDIAIGVTGEKGSQVLVFESPRGALRSDPEVFRMPAAVSALAMLALDDGHFAGLAAAAGNELIQIHGRDRKLSHLQAVRDAVPVAEITRQTVPFAVRALAVGRFTSGTLTDLAALGDDTKVHFLERPDADYQAAQAEIRASLPPHGGGPMSLRRASHDVRPLPAKPQTKELVLRSEVAIPSGDAAKLVTAHTSITGADDVIAVDGGASRLHVVSRASRGARSMRLAASLEVAGSPAAVLPMRMAPSALHGLVVLQQGQAEPSVVRPRTSASFMVTNTLDAGPTDMGSVAANTAISGSLRWAITEAANAGGTATISFHIPTSDPNYNASTGTFTIQPLPTTSNCSSSSPQSENDICQGLPILPFGTVIDGYTQPDASPNTLATGNNAAIKIVISGASAGNGPIGLWSYNGDNTIRGFDLIGFNAAGVPSTTPGQNVDFGGAGIELDSDSNFVEGNFSSMNAAGSAIVANFTGVASYQGPNTVGGTTPQARNLLTGGSYASVYSTVGGSSTSPFSIQGNYFGTDLTGAIALGGGRPVIITGAYHTFGGTTAGAGNLVSNGNVGPAIQADYDYANDNLFQGNLIGTDATGTLVLGNVGGISFLGGANNTIGGTTPAARNVISGTEGPIDIEDMGTSLTVQGNYIGLDITGGKNLGNPGSAIEQSQLSEYPPADGVLIGGDTPGAGNAIAGTTGYGINIGTYAQSADPTGTAILGNLIGTDATGTKAMGNGFAGIYVTPGGAFVTIGGADSGAGNVIANGAHQGILIDSSYPYPGQGYVDTMVGNSIFSNAGEGITMQAGTNDLISQNDIYSNGGLGIDIGNPNPASNSCQANATGPNNNQNAPVLTPASSGTILVSATAIDAAGNTSQFSNCAKMAVNGGTLTIGGLLNSLPNTPYTIEFFQNTACDPSGFGQGQAFLNRIPVTTGSNCIANFGDTINIATADLSVTLADSGVATLLSTVYTATVANAGGATAASVTFSDTLPASETLLSVTTTAGTCSASGNAVSCQLGIMLSGSTATITIAATINSSGTIANMATVSSTTPDSNSANNTYTSTITANYLVATLDHIDPVTAIAGIGAIPLLIYGNNFYQGVTTVKLNGTSVTPTVVSDLSCGIYFPVACQGLEITVPASLTASAGTVTVSIANPTPAQDSETATLTLYPNPGKAAQFLISGIPSAAAPGTAYHMVVTAADMNGNPITTYQGLADLTISGTYGFLTGPLDGTISPASPYQFTGADNGSHTFTVTFGEPSGGEGYLLTVQDSAAPVIGTIGGSLSGTSGPESFAQGPTPDPAPIGFPFDMPFTLSVSDDNGPYPGFAITFTAPASGAGGTFSNGTNTITVNTNSAGVAGAVLTANLTAGQFQVTASGNVPFAGVITLGTWTATSTTDVPTQIAIVSGNPQSGPVNTQFPVVPQVLLKDAQGNGVPHVTVTFAAPGSGASANFAPNTAVTAAAGGSVPAGTAALTGPMIANGTTGSYSLTATAGSLKATFAMTNTAGPNPAASLTPAGSGQSAVVFTAFASNLMVTPLDAHGNCLAQTPITFSAPSSGPSATLSATLMNSDPVTCTAQVTATANGIVGGPYNVTATAPGGASTTFALANTTNSGYLTAVSGTPQTAIPGRAFAIPLKAQLLDVYQRPLVGQIVNFMVPTAGASATLSSTMVLTDYTGTATVNATANGALGSYVVTASFGQVTTYFSLMNANFSACDVNQDGATNISDVQAEINEALGNLAPVSDLNSDNRVNAVDIQIVIDAVLKLGCSGV